MNEPGRWSWSTTTLAPIMKQRIDPTFDPYDKLPWPETDDRHDPHGCRFIYGHPSSGSWGYCNAKIEHMGKPYCSDHQDICYVKTIQSNEIDRLLRWLDRRNPR